MMALKVPLYPAEKAAKKSVVAVTGCTGYLAGSIVHRLLETGHTVHGTCRDPNKAKALKQDLPGAADRLKLFKAELTQPGSFDEAFQGCDYVVHCASPYINNLPANEVEEKMLKPAIQGTQNVLESVNKTATVKRVALTSSCAAIYGSPVERGYGHVFTEDDWCTTPSATVLPYYYSKKGAEKAAWDIVEKQNRWELVVINPPVIFGPPMTGRPDGESLAMMTQVFKGELYPACPKMGFGMADVRDVAAAHTLALVHPNAKGRYICCPRSVEFSELCKEVAQLYPSKVKAPWMAPPKLLLWLFAPAMGLKRDFVKHTVGLPPPQFSCAKIQRDLGFQFLDMKTTITDMAEKMTELKLMP